MAVVALFKSLKIAKSALPAQLAPKELALVKIFSVSLVSTASKRQTKARCTHVSIHAQRAHGLRHAREPPKVIARSAVMANGAPKDLTVSVTALLDTTAPQTPQPHQLKAKKLHARKELIEPHPEAAALQIVSPVLVVITAQRGPLTQLHAHLALSSPHLLVQLVQKVLIHPGPLSPLLAHPVKLANSAPTMV